MPMVATARSTVDTSAPALEAPRISSRSAADWAAWQAAGFDVNSVWADPLFVDAENDDYRLQEASPAFSLGFRAIDTSRVGPRGREATN